MPEFLTLSECVQFLNGGNGARITADDLQKLILQRRFVEGVTVGDRYLFPRRAIETWLALGCPQAIYDDTEAEIVEVRAIVGNHP